MHYVVTYELAADYLERRPQFRNVHLAHAWKAADEGHLLIGGALADPVDTALIVFTGDSPAVAEEFARTDPYVTHGLVKRWSVRPWNTVAGPLCASPVRAV